MRSPILIPPAFGFAPAPCRDDRGGGAEPGTGVEEWTATVLVVIFSPLFYELIEKVFGKHYERKAEKTKDENPSED